MEPLLGLIQGVFMFVPVSSTSHLALTQHWLIARGSGLPEPDSPEMIFFDLIVHVGTLVSMAVVFRKSLGQFLGHMAAGVRRGFVSFFVAFPTILGASAIQGVEVTRAPEPMTLGWLPLLVGFGVAAVAGIFALMLVLRLLYRARFRYFSYYVWALAALVGWNALRGMI
jgi:undecaprenyl pyrophosphate phosphatase UppP